MKVFRYLFVAILALGFSGLAKADVVDFHMGVLDPPSQLNYSDITGNTFPVTFGACPDFLSDAGITGCFTGLNDTSFTFTSLNMIFTNGPGLGGQPATCDTAVPGSVFGGADCFLSPDGTHYVLDFFGGSGIAPDTFFFITETGPAPDAFGTGEAIANVPEPGTVLLFSTGIIAMFGLLAIRQQRGSVLSAIRTRF
ncbi:PEP-CTERM sorting domain-containing protein [Edaphobacter bradus]|uniref:PEP-CTERM sorting domain-containing protein n=1 Tax=Edaphobacter bradus TaxID=2259016 RepID=UPI0021E0E346|nr:PEP-CTERM sorting domain-containing protein [Edaphobacter bradus]